MEKIFDLEAFQDPKKPYDLNERIKLFILSIFDFLETIPNTPAGRNINYQLAKASTSIGANYRASKRTRSNKEYLAKLGICEEEADETCFWLDLCLSTKCSIDRINAQGLLKEANELTAIIVTLIKNKKRKL